MIKDVLNLTVEFQSIMVAGFIANKITIIGRSTNLRSEEYIFRIISFGLIAKFLSLYFANIQILKFIPNINEIIIVSIGITFGILWRKWLAKGISWLMEKSETYRDDHENSVWQSIMQEKAKWTKIHIHLADGSILESDMGKEEFANVPMGRLTINEDGIATYITKIIYSDRTCDFPVVQEDGPQISYIPRSQITRMEICWLK